VFPSLPVLFRKIFPEELKNTGSSPIHPLHNLGLTTKLQDLHFFICTLQVHLSGSKRGIFPQLDAVLSSVDASRCCPIFPGPLVFPVPNMEHYLEQEEIARMKKKLVDSLEAASDARLQLKKHGALMSLIEDVEPELRQRLAPIYEKLDKEEAAIVEREIRATDSYGANNINGGPMPGELGNTNMSPALARELSPVLGRPATQQLAISVPSRAPRAPRAPRKNDYQGRSLSEHSTSSVQEAPEKGISADIHCFYFYSYPKYLN
jgi:hypothetical protein